MQRPKHLTALMSSLVTEGVLDGHECYIVPTVLMVEGVHNGILYTNEELSKYVDAWNGRPCPVFHPEKDGRPVTANSRDVLETQNIGHLLDARFEDGKLKANAYLRKDKVSEISPVVEQLLTTNQMIEVSTGMFMDEVAETGTWGDETFHAIAVNIRPDHLAFLPGKEGACSIKDGAGAPRINAAAPKGGLLRWLKNKVPGLKVNELSHEDVRRSLSRTLPREKTAWYSIEAVYEDHYIYARYPENDEEIKMFRQDYSVDNDEIVLGGNATEVRLDVKYIPVVNELQESAEPLASASQSQTTPGEDAMKNRKERVDALIANAASPFNADDAEFLTNLEDARLASFEKALVAETPPTPTTNETATAPAAPTPVVTLDALIANAAPEVRESLVEMQAEHKRQKALVVNALKESNRCDFSSEELEARPLSELRKLSKLCQVEVDHSLAGAAPVTNQEESESNDMPALSFD